jgi:hypothetical protein
MDPRMAKKALPTRTVNPLPFNDLDPHRFEDLVRNLIYDFRRWRTIEATGKGGSDDGFDVRAWEETSEIANLDEENADVGIHPMEGNLWKLQCKREKELGPTRITAIINEGATKTTRHTDTVSLLQLLFQNGRTMSFATTCARKASWNSISGENQN